MLEIILVLLHEVIERTCYNIDLAVAQKTVVYNIFATRQHGTMIRY